MLNAIKPNAKKTLKFVGVVSFGFIALSAFTSTVITIYLDTLFSDSFQYLLLGHPYISFMETVLVNMAIGVITISTVVTVNKVFRRLLKD